MIDDDKDITAPEAKIHQDAFAYEFGPLIDAKLSRIRMNKEIAVLGRNGPTNNTTLLEHVNP